MNKLISISMLLFSILSISQETDKEKALFKDACDCIDKIDLTLPEKTRYTEVEDCLGGAIMAQQIQDKLLNLDGMIAAATKDSIKTSTDSTSKDKKNVTINIDPRAGYTQLERQLIDKCSAMKRVLDNAPASSDNSISENKRARKNYDKAMEYYNQQDWSNALKYYNKSVKADDKFAFAWDMIGITYRRMGEYQKAVDSYKRSLAIDSRGKMPLQNLPIAYKALGENEKAAEVYKELIRYYPNDPEGYYGLSQTAILLADDSTAIENMMIAYKKYVETNSPYTQDAITILSAMYQEMDKKGKLDLFLEYADKYEIQFQNAPESKD